MYNLLLIGLGYHARRIYFPILQDFQKKKKVNKIFVIDLKSQEKIIKDYLSKKNSSDTQLFLLDKPQNIKLDKDIEEKINAIVKNNNIKGVIIATEPLAHMVYAKWALKEGLSILMDKPVSTYESIISNTEKAKKLIKDYNELLKLYKCAFEKKDNLVFYLMAQRRAHPFFKIIKNSIDEVYKDTNCPITSIQAYHGDGQWRFPTEIIEQDYHPYNQGYGVCSHSGYHIFDIVSWFMDGNDKNPDEMEVVSSFSTPVDLLSQYTFDDYNRDFEEFNKFNKYSHDEFVAQAKNFGEVDCFGNFVFKKNKKNITLVNVNMSHNSFSQRNWVDANDRDLYKGNGRVRQESYHISQGPFQNIIYNSYQSKEVDPNLEKDLFEVGGEYHAEIYIFRNSSFKPKWKCVQKLNVKDFIDNTMKDKSRGHQEEARREAAVRFLDSFLNKKAIKAEDLDLINHKRSVQMMSGIYQSISKRKKSLNPLIKIKLKND